MTLLAWVALISGFIAGAFAGVAFTVALVVGLWRWSVRVVQARRETQAGTQVETGDPLWVAQSRGYN